MQSCGKGADDTNGYCAKREEEGRPFTTHNKIGALNLEEGKKREINIKSTPTVNMHNSMIYLWVGGV